MDKTIAGFVEGILNIKMINEYEFREVCGFTFAFKKEAIHIKGQISSAEIKPIAIIYEENGEYYLAALDIVEQIDEVIKEFVEKQLIREEEYSHF